MNMDLYLTDYQLRTLYFKMKKEIATKRIGVRFYPSEMDKMLKEVKAKQKTTRGYTLSDYIRDRVLK